MHLHSRSPCSEKHSHLESTVGDGFKFLACCMYTGRSVHWLILALVVPAELQTHPMLGKQSQQTEGYCTWSPEEAHACHRFSSHLSFFIFFGAIWRTSIALAFRLGGPATAVEILHQGVEKASCCKILPREASGRAEQGGWCIWRGT